MRTKSTATIITVEQVGKTMSTLPQSWKQALGILQHKRVDPVRYQKNIRKDWTKRLRKQQQLAS